MKTSYLYYQRPQRDAKKQTSDMYRQHEYKCTGFRRIFFFFEEL